MRVSFGRPFFSRRKDSGRNLTLKKKTKKNAKFLRAPSSKSFRIPGKKKQLLEAKRKLYHPWDASHQKFKTGEIKKAKRKLYHPVSASCQKFDPEEMEKRRKLYQIEKD